ncbi:MAG TPA: tetratricopeptide repeat protein [Flavobacterium sp.]|jgi:tetratricopeptide (TPR) repeat protein
MKNLLLILVFFSQFGFSQGFEKGNELYRKNDFAGAAAAYESVLKTGKVSAGLYFNLGNAYYKQNKVAPAIYNYEKALLLNPGDKEIETNLEFAQNMRIDDIKELPQVGFSKFIRNFTANFHYDTWAWISICLSVLFLALFCGYYFTRSAAYKRVFFGAMILGLLLIIISVASAAYEKQTYENERPAIVFAPVISIKSEPSQDASDAFQLHEGTKVEIVETLENWRKIEIADGNTGWIEQNVIRELK